MAGATEKYAKQGKAWVGLDEAVKTAKKIAKKNLELDRIIEETNRQAEELDKLQIKDDVALKDLQQPLDELKVTARHVSNSGSHLKTCISNLIQEEESFDKYVRKNIRSENVPPEFLNEFCKAIEKLQRKSHDFAEELYNFISHLEKIQEQAIEVTTLINKKVEELNSSAGRAKGAGIAGTAVGVVGAGVGIASLIALGFFTGGAAWVVAGVAGAVCAVGGGVTAGLAFNSLSKLRELASGIQADANKLSSIAKELKISGDKVSGFKLDKEGIEALKSAFNFFKGEAEKEEERAKMKEVLDQKDAELARERSEKEELLAKLRALSQS